MQNGSFHFGSGGRDITKSPVVRVFVCVGEIIWSILEIVFWGLVVIVNFLAWHLLFRWIQAVTNRRQQSGSCNTRL